MVPNRGASGIGGATADRMAAEGRKPLDRRGLNPLHLDVSKN